MLKDQGLGGKSSLRKNWWWKCLRTSTVLRKLTLTEIQYSRIKAGKLKESWGSKWPWLLRSFGGAVPGAGTDRTVDVMQHVSDGSYPQVSIHDNLDPSGRLVVMEFVTAGLKGQEAFLPAEMRRMLRNGRISSKEIFLISSRPIPSSLNIICRSLVE